MKHLFTSVFVAIYCFSFSQTKLIAFKSHSGNLKNFETAINKDLFDTNDSNFGAKPERMVTNAQLDSVIYINEHKSVLVTSKTCLTTGNNKIEKWKPGRDTVYNHPLFSKTNIDSVKKVLKSQYHFKNDIDSVVFLQYDAKKHQYEKTQPQKKKPEKILSSQNNENPWENFLFAGVFLTSGLAGIYSWKRSKRKNGK